MILLDIKEVYTAINSDQRVRQLVKTAPLNIITANIIYWIILAVRFQMGVHNGTFGGDLSQIALQAALLFNSVYATKVWASGEADNEGGTAK